MNPFEFINAINYTKENLIVDDITEKEYNPYMINRGLSYFQDTILFANEMNQRSHIDNKLQNDFYLLAIRNRKRFSKWSKAKSSVDIEVIKEYYSYSNEKARNALTLLSTSELKTLRKKVMQRGRKRIN